MGDFMTARTSEIPVAAVLQASRRPEVVAAMQSLYRDADRRISEQGATCWNKGDCCKFGRFGHRLYVTALETACYLAAGDATAPTEADVCPHAHDGKCHARDRRPLGCRVFYCDPAARSWQGPLTEEFLARLRTLHDELDVPYFYADWMTVLRALSAHSC